VQGVKYLLKRVKGGVQIERKRKTMDGGSTEWKKVFDTLSYATGLSSFPSTRRTRTNRFFNLLR